jgi:2-polyprenyl-6-methoxyphenol hydroxylase-like FAD-dependent oxidoreductase
MYDVIVVGARCAGSPTAMLLARQGLRVLLVDRATFPSDTISTHWIHHAGVAYLQRWGLLERIRQTGCPPIHTITLETDGVALTGHPPPAGSVTTAFAPRRFVLDTILVEAAVEAGVEFREGFSVEDLSREEGRVVGIVGRTSAGITAKERGRIVVGADGRHSRVARMVQAVEYRQVPSLLAFYYSYWSGVGGDGVEIYSRPRRGIVVVPTNDNSVCIGVAWPRSEFHEFRRDIESNYWRTIVLVSELADRLKVGQREARYVGTADQPNFFRKPYGPGWALVGDAGYHKDAITAQGITDAFRDAELLSRAVHAGLCGRQALETALADYETTRNEAALPMYQLTCQAASIETPPPPSARLMLRALQDDQDEIDRYVGVIAGTVPVASFYSPEHIAQLMDRARRSGVP